MSADGCVAADGTVMLNSAKRAHLEFVRQVCTRLGIATYGITSQLREGFPGREPSIYLPGREPAVETDEADGTDETDEIDGTDGTDEPVGTDEVPRTAQEDKDDEDDKASESDPAEPDRT